MTQKINIVVADSTQKAQVITTLMIPNGIYGTVTHNDTPKTAAERMAGQVTFPWRTYILKIADGTVTEIGNGSSVHDCVEKYMIETLFVCGLNEQRYEEMLMSFKKRGISVAETLSVEEYVSKLKAA